MNDSSVTLYSRKAHHQPFRPAGGGAVSPRQDRGCGSRGSQECHETSGLWKSHRKEGTFRGRLCKTGQVKICHFWDHGILDLRWNGSLDCCSKIISFQSVLIRCLILFLSFRPRLVSMSPVKSSTFCDIPWSNASLSCLKTILAATAS